LHWKTLSIEEYAMQSGIKAALTTPIFLAIAGFATPGALSARTVSPRPSPAVLQLGVAPLEEAFLDAAVVRRTFASRAAVRARQ
jgi:hypothetical protein